MITFLCFLLGFFGLAKAEGWVPPSERTGFISLFMPAIEIPDRIFGSGQREKLIYVGSIFESCRVGVNGYSLGEDTYAQVWAIRQSRWALQFPRCFFEYPGASFGVPIPPNGGVGFAFSISFR